MGLHISEFSFKKVQKNVEDAVARFNIKCPVVLGNDYSTLNAYGNKYWPRKYLIDPDGYIIYDPENIMNPNKKVNGSVTMLNTCLDC